MDRPRDEDSSAPAGADSGESWLSLLENERSAQILETHRQTLSRADAADAAHIDLEYRQALGIQQRLAERKQQADYLKVLNDLARRLGSLHERDELLQEVATQARRLLGVDVAYIMLLKDDGLLRIEVADGSIGTMLRGIELGRGRGLGGEVIRTGRPIWTEDYLTDRSFPHLAAADEAAAGERLAGILGVPLLAADEPIGVLLAADRQPRKASDHDIELLAALAAHAAVAIRNAGLFERYRDTVTELRAANTALEDGNAVRRRAADLRETLTALVIGGGRHDRIARAVAQATGCKVAVLGTDGEVLAGDAGPPTVPSTSDDDPADGPASVGGLARRRTAQGPAVFAPIPLRDGDAGCVVAWGSEISREMENLVTIGASSAALVVASERSIAEAELRSRGEFISALLSPDADSASIRRRARSAQIDIDRVRSVVVIRPGTDDPRDSRRLGNRLAHEFRGWTAEHAGHVVLLIPAAEPPDVRERLNKIQPNSLPCTVGIASTGGGASAVREAHDRARQTVAVLLALGHAGTCADEAELGIYRTLFNQAGRNDIVGFVSSMIGPLLEHDAAKYTDLVRTLDVYLRQSRHHVRTCSLLHIHANTLYQRLNRINQLLAPGSLDPERVIEVQLALRMHGLMSALRPSTDT